MRGQFPGIHFLLSATVALTTENQGVKRYNTNLQEDGEEWGGTDYSAEQLRKILGLLSPENLYYDEIDVTDEPKGEPTLDFNGDTYFKPNAGDAWFRESDSEPVKDEAASALLDALYDSKDALETEAFFEQELEAEERGAYRETDYDADQLHAILDLLSAQDLSSDAVRAKLRQPGALYKADIPGDDVLLDEQKPIGEQPAEVLQGLRRVVGSLSANELETFFRRIGYRESEDGKERGEGAAETYFHDEGAMQNQTGRDFYRALAAAYKSARSASQTLNAHGIKGIAYGGRQDGRCCVVFDDKAIEILGKFSAKGEGAKLRQMFAAAKFLKADDLTAEERNLSAIGEEMGTPVVWMDGDASLHGFHSGGVTFLNRRSEMRLPQVFWHESFHYMRANNPALYGEMVHHVERAEHITKEQMDAYREKIGRPSLSDADVIEEMLADRMQDVKERVRLLKGMGRENAGLAARIAAWIRRMIDRFVAHFRRAGDRLSERQTAAMAEAFSCVMHDMKDGEGKPLFRVRGKSVRMADGRELPALDAKEQTADEKLKADAKAWKQTLKEAWEAGGAKKAWCVL
ncbi:hypothetical protein HMPREF1985_00056 [Mitsuokella sp. oral taxon 131 str. W9106]|nr:hypothetical protein HMPREF1985_00056 [Mitsuokella sp. oral taxon 131 str. W9106]